tara:strand:- start:1156 stop:1710 length:555 start_codon:yes stop_codon:yes gene_type:complete
VKSIEHHHPFESCYDYYHVLFHELIHATGHASRLNRDTLTMNKKPDHQAVEELTAEIGAHYLSQSAHIDQHINMNHSVAYINHWKNTIESYPHALVMASRRAHKAMQYILEGAVLSQNKPRDNGLMNPPSSRVMVPLGNRSICSGDIPRSLWMHVTQPTMHGTCFFKKKRVGYVRTIGLWRCHG